MAGTSEILIPIAPCSDSHVRILLAANSTCLVLAWVSVLLRFATRSYIIRSVGSDDIMILCGVICYTVYCITVIVLTAREPGHTFLTSSQTTLNVNLLLVSETFYIVTMIFVKLSLGFFFLRIFFDRLHRRIVYTVMVMSTVFGAAYFFFIIFQCGTPIGGATFWRRFIGHQCVGDSAVLGIGYTHAIITTLTDATCACLPIVFLRKSGLSLGKKFIVGGILVIGAIGGVASIVRVTYIKALTNPGLDFLCKMLSLALWSAIEPGLGIIAASLATLRPLLRTISRSFDTWRSTIGNRSTLPGNTGRASEQFEPPKRHSERGFSVLKEHDVESGTNKVNESGTRQKSHANMMVSGTTDSQISIDKQEHNIEEEEQRPEKSSWWTLPAKPFGLVTDFRQATKDIRLENMDSKRRSDMELDRRNG